MRSWCSTASISPGPTARTTGEKIDDAPITAQVKMSLLSHRSTSALKTKVESTDGVVTLTGVTKNAAEKALVTKLATAVNGGSSLVNNMAIGTALSACLRAPWKGALKHALSES